MISGHTAIYGLLGRPIRHSLSPQIHNRWFAELRHDAIYVPFDVPDGRVPDPVGLLRDLGVAGLNLTVPFKGLAVDGCDTLCPMARVADAINVLVRRGDAVEGHNTDGAGFTAAFEAAHGPVAGRRAVILGAGGAGRAVAAGLCARGVHSMVLANRTEATATAAVKRIAASWPGVSCQAAALHSPQLANADIVVMATGSQIDASSLIEITALPTDAVWCDLDYRSADTPGRAAARDHGLAVLDGLGMLVHQAALAFELWTEHRPDAAATLAHLQERPPGLPNPQGS